MQPIRLNHVQEHVVYRHIPIAPPCNWQAGTGSPTFFLFRSALDDDQSHVCRHYHVEAAAYSVHIRTSLIPKVRTYLGRYTIHTYILSSSVAHIHNREIHQKANFIISSSSY